jgi:alkylation response protein AidB-like acyl-CoA dehydrogenase
MNLAFDEQQEMMRKSLKSFLEKHYPVSKAREFMESDKEEDRELWQGIADLGITGILVDEEFGGLGLSLIDQLVIQEEVGRYLTPAPIKVNAVATSLLNKSGNAEDYREVLEGITEGKTICTIGFLESNGKWFAPAITQVRNDGNGYVINGVKIGVAFAAMSDYVVVTAQEEQQKIGLYLVPLEAEGVSYRRVKTVDGTQPWYEIRLENVSLEKTAKIVEANQSLIEYAMELGAIFTCAESLGGMERVLNTTADYAKERVQFGKPIGSFQAIKHKLADMLVGIETVKAITYYAALEVEERAESRSMSLASAKVLSADTYHSVVREGIQIHGGMGFTWESDLHLYLRRSVVNQTEYGDPGQYRKIIRQELNLGTKIAQQENVPAGTI